VNLLWNNLLMENILCNDDLECMNSLQHLGEKFNTDKATRHSYLDIYDGLFSKIRRAPIKLLEIGVDNGCSLRMWDKFFTNKESRIVGCDLHLKRESLRDLEINDKIFLVEGDQSNFSFLSQLIVDFAPFDIVIDDGSHNLDHQLFTYAVLGSLTRKFYVIEDLYTSKYIFRFRHLAFTSFDFSENGIHDDIMLIKDFTRV
jgi:hypothetical protein